MGEVRAICKKKMKSFMNRPLSRSICEQHRSIACYLYMREVNTPGEETWKHTQIENGKKKDTNHVTFNHQIDLLYLKDIKEMSGPTIKWFPLWIREKNSSSAVLPYTVEQQNRILHMQKISVYWWGLFRNDVIFSLRIALTPPYFVILSSLYRVFFSFWFTPTP